jgi:hypothetical protein
MNKPVDPERIANENTVEEQKTNITPEEGVTTPAEKTGETAVIIEEQIISEGLPETVSEGLPDTVSEALPETVSEALPETVSEALPETVSEALPESVPEQEVISSEVPAFDKWDKEEIINHLSLIVQEPLNEELKSKVDALKQAFYKLKRVEIEDAKQSFIQAGGQEEDFVPETDEWEEKLKAFLAIFREKRALVVAETEKVKEDNLLAKKAIIEQLKILIDSKDDFYKVYDAFRKLQSRWKEIKQVPQTAVNDLWKEYQHYTEKFYDLLKINNEMRDYDFKKNLEMKQLLCKAVERLDEEQDVISAFYQLQKLHQEWREIGPVAKEFRDEIWLRFRKASSVINKKHQEHFESLRSLEHRNLEEKVAFCEEIENIDYTKLNTFKEWDVQNKKVLDIQEKWKTIGFAPRKSNVRIFERFRASCDVFFSRKSDFYKSAKSSMDVNMEKKRVLCEKVEA